VTAQTRVLRFSIPVDDTVHTVPAGTGRIVHVDCRERDVVDVWVESTTESTDPPGPAAPRSFFVIGTGLSYPPGAAHVGTALTPAVGPYPRGELVWHVVEVTAP